MINTKNRVFQGRLITLPQSPELPTVTSAKTTRPSLVIIGHGVAATKTVERLIRENPNAYYITIVGDEPHHHYNRIMLSPLLAGDIELDGLFTAEPPSWYQEHNIRVLQGHRAQAINPQTKQITLTNGETLNYDALILATGSRATVPNISHSDADNVIGFRTLNDVDRLLALAANVTHAMVIGAGLLGIEAAAALAKQGKHTTLVHRQAHIMNRQLDATAAGMLQATLAERNVHCVLNHQIDELTTDNRGFVNAITLTDRQTGQTQTLPVGLLVFAIGITPNIELAANAGIDCERAIIVDEYLRTSDPDIYALGECVQFQQQLFGLVEPVVDQANVLAKYLLEGKHSQPLVLRDMATKLKVSGIKVYSAGVVDAQAQQQTIVMHDPSQGVYKKMILDQGQLVGMVLMGDVSDGPWFYEQMQSKQDLSEIAQIVVFGAAFVEHN